MAEIEIERRPRRSGWTWVALLLVLAGVAVGVWLVFGSDTTRTESPPAAEVAPEPGNGAAEPLERAPAGTLPRTDGTGDGAAAPPAPGAQEGATAAPDGGGTGAERGGTGGR